MKFLTFILCFFALSALSQVLPPSPLDVPTKTLHSPNHKAFLASLGSPMAKTARTAPALAPASVIVGALMWDWAPPPGSPTNVLFDVYHSASPATGPPLARYDQIPFGFTLLISVTAPPVPVGGLQQEYFIVRARDIVSGVVSDWNQP